MTTDWRLATFIRKSREQYGNIGREKIKIFLDEYAAKFGIDSISHRTITKVIKQRNLFFDPLRRIKRKNKFARHGAKRSPKTTSPGFVEVDSVTVYINSKRRNFICCIDIYTKLTHVRKVKTLSNLQVKLTLAEFQASLNYSIHTV